MNTAALQAQDTFSELAARAEIRLNAAASGRGGTGGVARLTQVSQVLLQGLGCCRAIDAAIEEGISTDVATEVLGEINEEFAHLLETWPALSPAKR